MSTASARVTINVGGGALQAPPQAAAVGYTRLSYQEEFDDTSGIDMADSQADGFNLYRKYVWGKTAALTDFNVANSVLTLAPDISNQAYGLMSCTSDGAGDACGNGIFYRWSVF